MADTVCPPRPGVDPPHLRGLLRLDHKMVPVRRVLAVAVGRIGPDKLAHLPARLERGAHLAGDVLCVKVVEDRPEGGHIALLGGRVDAVVHRDVADAPLGKIPLEVVARQDVVAPETGEVLGEHRVDPARLDVLHHAQEARPVEVRPRVAVVRVDFHDGQAVFPAVVQQEIPLVPDALGGAVPVAVLLGKAQVERRARRAHGPLRSRSSICPPPAPIYAARRRTMRRGGTRKDRRESGGLLFRYAGAAVQASIGESTLRTPCIESS